MPNRQKRNCYPYRIRPISDELAKGSKYPWAVNLFFLAESILRCQAAHQAYLQGEGPFSDFLKDHGVGFNPLEAEHHMLLRADARDKPNAELSEELAGAGNIGTHLGITDLTTRIKHGPSPWWPGGESQLIEELRNPIPRFVYLQIDVSNSASALIEDLRPFLADKHQQWSKSRPSNIGEAWMMEHRNPVFRDVGAWIKYFRCYDLRYCDENLPFSEIAAEVYGEKTDATIDNAEKGFSRVQRLITAAETKQWPPLNPSK